MLFYLHKLILYPDALDTFGYIYFSFLEVFNRVSLVVFLTCILLVSFSCLIASASASSTTLQRSGDRGNPCLISAFNRIASSFSPFKTILTVGLFVYLFIYWCTDSLVLRCAPSSMAFYRTFITKARWILSNAFSASIETII